MLAIATLAGVTVVSQFTVAPSIKLTPSISLAGNPVGISIVPPGLVLAGSFFKLKALTYWPLSDPGSAQRIEPLDGLSVTHVFPVPGTYILEGSYVNGGTAGSITRQLVVLPSNFTAGPLEFGSNASFSASNGSITMSNPYGIFSAPAKAGGVSTTLSILSISMTFGASLETAVSNSAFTARDGLGLAGSVYAVNSTLSVTGHGYVIALAAGFGLNLTASMVMTDSSTLLNSMSGNSTLSQSHSLQAAFAVNYLGGVLNLTTDTTLLVDSYAPLSGGEFWNMMPSELEDSGTFAMPAKQLQLYERSLPAELSMNLSGNYHGYSWKTGAYRPSLNLSTLAVDFNNGSINASYSVTLASDSAFPASIALNGMSDVNGTHTALSLSLQRTSVTGGTSAVQAGGVFSPGVPRGNYTHWTEVPLLQLNDSALMPFSLQSAYAYALNHTSIASYLSSNSNAFLLTASYNFTLESWEVTMGSPAGNMYALSAAYVNESIEVSGRAYSGTGVSPPSGGDVLTVASAADIVAHSPYASAFLNATGALAPSSVTFELNMPFMPAPSPFLPPPGGYAQYGYLLVSPSGNRVAVDGSNGQLMYFAVLPSVAL